MNFIETKIPGVLLIENKMFEDNRGLFIKHFQNSMFRKHKIDFRISEVFYSVSALGVIRGLHFQVPPYTQEKLVFVAKGKINDIVLDLRKNSPSYLKYITVKLTEDNNKSIFIPKGCAHGFQSLENDTITVYTQSEEYNADTDSGINPLSLTIEWEISEYKISEKDKNLINMNDFISPFSFKEAG